MASTRNINTPGNYYLEQREFKHSENYTLYHECSLKNTSWIDWYQKQKKVFEGD